jgi:hypothetical protein
MTETASRARAPWHLWALALVSLIWFAGGANDYLQTKLGNREYLAMAAEGSGVSLEIMDAYVASFPLWATIAWALGVWGAVGGSLLLVLRSRFAVHAFIASLAGVAVTTAWTYASEASAPFVNTFQILFSVLIWLSVIGMAYYSSRMTKAGVLR